MAIALFTLSSPQIVQGLRFEQLALVVGFLLIAGAWCVSRHHLWPQAHCSRSPPLSLRWRFCLCAGLQFGLQETGAKDGGFRFFLQQPWRCSSRLAKCFCPDGSDIFVTGLAAYRRYALPTSTLGMALGNTLGEIVGGIIVLGLFAFAWRNRKVAGDSRQFSGSASRVFHGCPAGVPTVYTIQPGATDSSCDVTSARLEDSAPSFQNCFRRLHRLALDYVDRPIVVSSACRFVQSTPATAFFPGSVYASHPALVADDEATSADRFAGYRFKPRVIVDSV